MRDPHPDLIEFDRAVAEYEAMVDAERAAATQTDDTECVCRHPRSDHGDGVVHTACCGLTKVPAPSGDLDVQCECHEFESR